MTSLSLLKFLFHPETLLQIHQSIFDDLKYLIQPIENSIATINERFDNLENQSTAPLASFPPSSNPAVDSSLVPAIDILEYKLASAMASGSHSGASIKHHSLSANLKSIFDDLKDLIQPIENSIATINERLDNLENQSTPPLASFPPSSNPAVDSSLVPAIDILEYKLASAMASGSHSGASIKHHSLSANLKSWSFTSILYIHLFRTGAAGANINLHLIKSMGHWTSSAVDTYIRPSPTDIATAHQKIVSMPGVGPT
ncbi:UNVERIFIED_CONTAM: hypothetical protein FKN15_002238 [Acipenser sinensis]